MKSAEPAVDPFQRVARESLSDAIVNQIIQLITSGVLKPGDRLPSERDLCKTLGVGRTSVREALKPLLLMGILEGRGGSGTFVADNGQFLKKALEWGLLFDSKRVEDLIETRMMLETNAAYWAATRASEENLQAIEATLDGMRNSIDNPKRFQRFDVQFHLEIARATQNSILFSLVNMMRRYVQVWIQERLAAVDRSELAQVSLDQHQAIMARLKAKDATAAQEAMRVHIDTASTDLRSYLNATSSD